MIDEFYFSVITTIMGSGIKLFPALQVEKRLKFITTAVYNGIVDLVTKECKILLKGR